MGINWNTSKVEQKLLHAIAVRAVSAAHAVGSDYPIQDAEMDVTAAHLNGNPLRLAELLAADEFNFSHDIFGIRRFLDRSNGKLDPRFSPRFSR